MLHRSASRFSTGVPVSATRQRAGKRPATWAARVAGFLTFCASSSTSPSHVHARQPRLVPMQQGVGADDDVLALGEGDQLLGAGSIGAVVDVDAQLGREAGQLVAPVAHDRGRADDERRRQVGLGCFAPCQDQGNDLDRLAQPHVVGQQCPQAVALQGAHPVHAALLIWSKRANQAVGCRERPARCAVP